MIGVKIPVDKTYLIEIPLIVGVSKYNFPDIPFLKGKSILAVEAVTPNATLVSPNNLLCNKIDSFKMTLINEKSLVIVDSMPLLISAQVFKNGFVLNDTVKFSSSFIEIPLVEADFAPRCILLTVYYTDTPKSNKGLGYKSEKVNLKKPFVWQKLNNLTKLDNTLKIVSFTLSTSDANPCFFNLINTAGEKIFDTAYDRSISSSNSDASAILEIYKISPLKVDFQKSEVMQTGGIGFSLFVGAFYERDII